MSLRVLHVFPTFAAGGAQMRTLGVMDALGDEFQHEVLPLDGSSGALESPMRPETRARVRLLEPPPKAGSLATARWIRALLLDRSPDLLCTYNWGAIDALLALRALGALEWTGELCSPRPTRPAAPRALLHHEEGFHPDEALGPLRRRTWTRRVLLPQVDRTLVPSRGLYDQACTTWGLSPERVRLIPNGVSIPVECAEPRGAGIRAELGIDAEVWLFGFVGPLRAEKNPRRLVATLAELLAQLEASAPPAARRVELLIVGDGPERATAETLAESLGIRGRVHFAGHRPDPAPGYRALDAFLLASDTEQLPLALLEAMAHGLPVVSTDVGDVALTLPETQRAFVVEGGAGAEKRLAAGLLELLQRGEWAQELGQRNRARVRDCYSREAMVASYRECYGLAMG